VSDSAARPVDVQFAERLWPSPVTWLLAPGLGAGVAISLWPVGVVPAVAVGVLVAVGVVAGLVAASPRVEVADGHLRAGRARVPLSVLGTATWADGEEARQLRGPRLDARAYLCIRGWVSPVVRVTLVDPADPTPYWLVSTRRPDELAGVLSAGRRHA
jgi:hypothetical protein